MARMLFSASLSGALLVIAASASAASAPPAASAAGYSTNTFNGTFTEQTVDLKQSGNPGFQWYPWALFGRKTNLGALHLNGDGTITLQGDTSGPNGEIVSILPTKDGGKFVGTAFGGGGYIEAEFKFNPDDVAAANSKGWPAFWALSLEDTALGGSQWPGQASGYRHSVEADFFEYLYLPYKVPRNVYGAGLHDWFGVANVTCPKGLCAQHMNNTDTKRVTAGNTDMNQFHRYGFLWVPATASRPGYARFLFDDKPMGPDQKWTQFNDQPPPPTNQPWAFGRLDQQHLVLILGTGVNEPMTIRGVNVWQASDSANVHR